MATHPNAAIAVDVLRSHLDQLNDKIATLTEERDTVAKALESLLSHGGGASAGCSADLNNRSHSAATDSIGNQQKNTTDLTGLIVDFAGAANLRERLIRIAQAGEGVLLNITEVSRFLIGVGESRATIPNLRTNVHDIVNGSPEFFEKVSSGTYRFVEEKLKEDNPSNEQPDEQRSIDKFADGSETS